MNKKGFTLAEVLIVVSILGIIAVITVPGLISNYRERATITKVKKTYATLTTGYSAYVSTNFHSLPHYSDTKAGAIGVYNDLIKPYFEISYDAGTDKTKKEKILGTENKYLNGTKAANYAKETKFYAVKLKDGSVIFVRGSDSVDQGQKGVIFLDVNGSSGPNVVGRDIFVFRIYNEELIAGTCYTGIFKSKECADRCLTGDGTECTEWILLNSDMKYLKQRNN